MSSVLHFFFFFNDTATTEIYTLSLHDALPISLPRRRANARNSSLSSSAGALFCSRFRQCLDKNWQNVAGGNVLQIPGDRLCKLNVGIEFVDQLPDERHVDRPCHDVDAIRADIGSDLNFSHDDCFFGKKTAAA